jgi:hypothetical protein
VSLREAKPKHNPPASILRAGGIAYGGDRAPSERRHIVMSTSKVTRVTLLQRVRDLIAGTMKHSPTGPLSLGGRAFTAQSLLQFLQDMENAISQVDTAKASWKDALKSLADMKSTDGPILGAYRSWIVATYGNAPATLADFGLAPPKVRTPQTADQKAVAVAKRAATRTARHTAGPKQKAAIKGNVTVAVVTTPAAPLPAKAT